MTSQPRTRQLDFLRCRWRRYKRVELRRHQTWQRQSLPNSAEAGRLSQEAVPVEQGQPLREVEPDEWAMKVRAKPIPETPTRRQRDIHELTHLPPVGVQHACLEKPLMIRIGDGKTQEILYWTLLCLITVTFQQSSVS